MSTRIRLTAQLLLSNTDAFLAYSIRNATRGPNGETQAAVLLRTCDAGESWTRLPLRRTLADGIRHWGFPTCPPEAVIKLTMEQSGLQMIFRDEWVPFEPGGESLWQAVQHRNGKWTTSRIRYMDYQSTDSPAEIPGITLRLPNAMKKPGSSLLATLASPST